MLATSKSTTSDVPKDFYRTLLQNFDDGFCIFEMLYDERGEPYDYCFLETNATFEHQTGLKNAVGKRAKDLVPSLEAHWIERYNQIAVRGEASRFIDGSAAMGRWFDVYAFRVGDSGSRKVALVFRDISAQKRRERNLEFLDDLARVFPRLEAANAIMDYVSERVATFLGVPYCHFMAIDEAKDEVRYLHRWNKEGVLPLPDTVKLSEHITDDFRQLAHAGETVASSDTGLNPITKGEANAAIAAAAFITVPFLKGETWAYQFSVHDVKPRQWRDDEIELVTEVATRTFPRLERAFAEAALRESQAELERQTRIFDTTLSTIRDYVYNFDKEGRFLYANQILLDLWQLSKEEALGKTMRDLNYPEDVERKLLEGVREVFETGKTVTNETFYTSPDGTSGYFENILSPFFAPDGSVEFVSGSSRDISERKLSEARVRESEARFRTMADYAPVMIWVTEPDGSCSFLSQTWYAFTGQTPETGLGYGWLEATHPDDRSEAEHVFLEANKRRESFRLEYRLRANDGSYRWHLDSAQPRFSGQGEFLGYIGSVLDISERKEMEEELRKANEQLKQLSETQKRFVADAAHELRAPLTAIQGNLQLLSMYDTVETPMRHAMLDDVQRESQRLSRLVNDLLAIARGDSGLKLEITTLALEQTLLGAWRDATLLSASHTWLLGDLPRAEIKGDADRLKQLALILLENAVKYTPQGGSISLGLELSENEARFYVRDTGIGITQEDLPKVFERFYRADKARTRGLDTTGTGLGLSIAQWIVQQHGGQIWLESELGRGTTAWVSLPLVSSST